MTDPKLEPDDGWGPPMADGDRPDDDPVVDEAQVIEEPY